MVIGETLGNKTIEELLQLAKQFVINQDLKPTKQELINLSIFITIILFT